MTLRPTPRCGAWGVLGHAGALDTLCGDLAVSTVQPLVELYGGCMVVRKVS